MNNSELIIRNEYITPKENKQAIKFKKCKIDSKALGVMITPSTMQNN